MVEMMDLSTKTELNDTVSVVDKGKHSSKVTLEN
jgi:hypothetical protein